MLLYNKFIKKLDPEFLNNLPSDIFTYSDAITEQSATGSEFRNLPKDFQNSTSVLSIWDHDAQLFNELNYQLNDWANFIELNKLVDYLNLSYFLFLVGIAGIIFNYKNFLITMLSIELMYFGIICGFLFFSIIASDPTLQIYAIILLILAAAESAVGLGLLIVFFKYGRSINFSSYQELRG